MGELPCVVAVAPNLCDKCVIGVCKQRLKNNENELFRKTFESSCYNANRAIFKTKWAFWSSGPDDDAENKESEDNVSERFNQSRLRRKLVHCFDGTRVTLRS